MAFIRQLEISRVRQNSYNANRQAFPMNEIKDKLIKLLLVMAKLKRSLAVSECLYLANDFIINGALTQNNIIAWKKKQKRYHKNPLDFV